MLKLVCTRRPQPITQLIIPRFYAQSMSEREQESHISEEDRKRIKNARKLKAWRGEPKALDNFLAFNISSNRHGIFAHTMSCKLSDWINWYKRHQIEYLRWSQKYLPERQQTLGNDLALATFLLHRGGKVKQKGMSKFMTWKDIRMLPVTYEPLWFIEEVDVSGTKICYEGLENFTNIHRLKKASFRNCPHFDDWCLERIVSLCSNLQVLDISENTKITERGLESLYRAWNLKKLIVTDWGHGTVFELTCMMLEDVLPGLEIEIKKAEDKNVESGDKKFFESKKLENRKQLESIE